MHFGAYAIALPSYPLRNSRGSVTDGTILLRKSICIIELLFAPAHVSRTHINYTNNIHFNGLLLPWHRQFLFLWETTLREECGYKGSVP